MYVIECSNFVIMYDCMFVRKKEEKNKSQHVLGPKFIKRLFVTK